MPQESTLATAGDISEEVRAFYDRYPYPPPIANLEKYQLRWQDLERRRADFHLFWPGRRYREDYSILIAGCGTSQAAKHALRRPKAHVTGIDVSNTSVYHTQKLKERHDIRNLQVYECPIESVAELGESFDQIVCTGVLHHLADPDAGLRALHSALKPHGTMQVMVYARYGRLGIYMLQEFCRRIGIRRTAGAVPDMIRALTALPSGHPLQSVLVHAPELRDEAALADALLHPQDRAYSVPELFALIESAGLKFGRWIRQAPYSARCGVIDRLPQAREIARLPLVEQYSAIELFRGTMPRHSAVLYQRDFPSNLYSITFDGDDWLRYVPLRVPDTACIEDHTSQGSAALLINRTHTHKDLFLAIRQIEKNQLDAIDGHRTVGDILKETSSCSSWMAHIDAARVFFERLWWYDQVVFDISQTCS